MIAAADEKEEWIEKNKDSSGSQTGSNHCSSIKVRDAAGNESTGGECKRLGNIHSMFKNNPTGSIDKFKQDIESYKQARSKRG